MAKKFGIGRGNFIFFAELLSFNEKFELYLLSKLQTGIVESRYTPDEHGYTPE